MKQTAIDETVTAFRVTRGERPLVRAAAAIPAPGSARIGDWPLRVPAFPDRGGRPVRVLTRMGSRA